MEDKEEAQEREDNISIPLVKARLLIVCEDGMLSCTAALSLLLSHYHTSIDFNTRLPCPQGSASPGLASTPGRQRERQREREKQGVCIPSRSKEEIKTCLTALQMHVPFADQLPRRLVKELNMYFASTSTSSSLVTRKHKQ